MNSLSVWGKGEKIARRGNCRRERVRACRQTFEVATPPSCLVIADHLLARSLSVTWIHWNVITLAGKKGICRQHTTFASCQNTVFSSEFLLWRVDYALECLVLIEKMWCLPLISYWEFVTRILIFCGCCFCLYPVLTFKIQEHLLPLKKLIRQAPEDAMWKIRRLVYKRLFKINRVLRADQKSDVNQTCQKSVFSPIACIRIWCSAVAVERRPQMFFYRLSPFPHLAIFSPFLQTESLFTG